MLYLIITVTNQALQQYKIQKHLALLKERNSPLKYCFQTFLRSVYWSYFSRIEQAKSFKREKAEEDQGNLPVGQSENFNLTYLTMSVWTTEQK